jgi:dTDP-4-amino-4,6-dideoxygalactose transaminase
VSRDPETIPANPFGRLWALVGGDVLKSVERVGASGWYVLGREVETFEADFAAATEAHHAIGCASGLDAIEIALRALGLASGDAVLTTPLSAFATTLAIVRAGGVPVFVDVDDSGGMDLALAEEVLDGDSSVRFAVPVHLYGHPMDLDALGRLRDRFDLRMVEDAAQAVGARASGRAVGSVGQATAVSFYPTKNLGAFGDGGCVLTPDVLVADACRSLRDYGQSAKYVHDRIGLNSRLDEVHAAVLRTALLPRLEEWTHRRRELAERYRGGLGDAIVRWVEPAAGAESVWHLFPVRVPDGRRDELLAHLQANGVQAGIHYPGLIPEQPALAGREHRSFGELTNARRFCDEEISLPIHPLLRDDEIDRVIDVVNGWPA